MLALSRVVVLGHGLEPSSLRSSLCSSRSRVLGFSALAAVGCSGAVGDINIRPHREATLQLIAPTPALTLDDCGMFGGSRSGWCTIAGTGPDLQLFVQGLSTSLVGSTLEFSEHSCVSKPEFGTPGSYGFLLKPGVQRFDVVNAVYPNNAHLRAVTVDLVVGKSCLDFEYPYG